MRAPLTCVAVRDAPASTPRPPASRIIVIVRPSVVRLGRPAVVEVRGPGSWRRLELRLKGSTTAIGLLSPWVRLRLHDLQQRLIAAYTPRGDLDPTDRLGIFITAVRIDFRARWRLLEATVRP